MFVRDDALILMLLRFPQEIRDAAKLDLPSSSDKQWQASKKEMELAGKLIDEMTGKWRPGDFKDDYREALMEYIDKKISKGDSVDDVKQPDKDEEPSGKVLDLAEYLERSFKKTTPGGKASAAAKPKPKTAKKHVSKKVPAKKAAVRKGRRSA